MQRTQQTLSQFLRARARLLMSPAAAAAPHDDDPVTSAVAASSAGIASGDVQAVLSVERMPGVTLYYTDSISNVPHVLTQVVRLPMDCFHLYIYSLACVYT